MYKNLIFLLLISPIFIILNSCSSSSDNTENPASIYDKRWLLRAFDDEKVFIPESKQEPFIFLEKKDNKANGFGGCNNFNLIFKRSEKKIKFENISATEKFCEFSMDLEERYINVLEKTDSYKIKENFLYFYVEKKLLAKFEYTGVN